ncbi:MAG: hypothetical protein ABSG67_05200 [Thermoguttaceae bacterium]
MTSISDIRHIGKDIFAVLGELACKFASLEFAMSEILARLVYPENPYIVDILTPSLPFSANIDRIKKFSNIRLQNNRLKSKLHVFINDAENFRFYRNFFFYGLCFLYVPEQTFTIDELLSYADIIGELVTLGFRIVQELDSTAMIRNHIKPLKINIE